MYIRQTSAAVPQNGTFVSTAHPAQRAGSRGGEEAACSHRYFQAHNGILQMLWFMRLNSIHVHMYVDRCFQFINYMYMHLKFHTLNCIEDDFCQDNHADNMAIT